LSALESVEVIERSPPQTGPATGPFVTSGFFLWFGEYKPGRAGLCRRRIPGIAFTISSLTEL
jgi:hypothetical protein